jgi:hypothetical protein
MKKSAIEFENEENKPNTKIKHKNQENLSENEDQI